MTVRSIKLQPPPSPNPNPKGVCSRGSGFEGPVQTRLWAVGIAVGGQFLPDPGGQ